jgi:DNA-directed RNA polymerase specialized sigma subunit
MTIQEIGIELGISHQMVSVIVNNALKKVRKQLKKHDLTYEDLLKCLKYS